MPRYSRKKKESAKKIAKQHVTALIELAGKVFKKDPSLSNRYITIARKTAMKHKVRIPSELKRKFCKHCYKYLMPGKTLRVRTHGGKVVYYCLNCKKYMRFPYKGKKK